ncbi:hypothetical protein ABBQ38_011740 [Trebouxia sp. C0009 RCD-2024]
MLFKPNGTKTVKAQRSGPFPLTVGVDATHSFLGRLPAFLKGRMQPDAPSNTFLFSALTADRRVFMTVASLHLTLANAWTSQKQARRSKSTHLPQWQSVWSHAGINPAFRNWEGRKGPMIAFNIVRKYITDN